MTYSHKHTSLNSSRLIFTLLYTLSASTSAFAAYSYANNTYQGYLKGYSSAVSDIIGESISSSALSDYIANLPSDASISSSNDVSFVYSSSPQGQDEDDSVSYSYPDDLTSGVDLFYDESDSDGDGYGTPYSSYYYHATGFPNADLAYQSGDDDSGDGAYDEGWYRDRDRDKGGGRGDDLHRKVGVYTKGGTTYVVDVIS